MKTQKMMVTKIGGPENFKLVEETLNPPTGTEVLIKIQTAGIAFADVLIRYGQYPGVPKPPMTPGYDLVGIVEAVGEDVTTLQTGDHVAALTVHGAYSSRIKLPEDWLIKIPAALDPVKAVALVLNYVTAYQMMHRIAKVQPGQRVLIHGASGGVGTALMQLGKLAGLEMIGTASKGKHDLLAQYGATPIDYRSQDFENILKDNPVDVVFESISSENLRKSMRILKKGGTLVSIGARASVVNGVVNKGDMVKAFMYCYSIDLLPNGKKAKFYVIDARKESAAFREDLTQLMRWLEAGKIDPVIGATFPLSQAAEANKMMESGNHRGKIVLLCEPV